MHVVEATTHLGVIQTTNPEDTNLPPKLQSHLAHLPQYASPATKALSLSDQSLAYYLTKVLNASIGLQALDLTHPTTALQPATRAVTKAWAAHGGWLTFIPTRAIGAAWPHYGDAIGNEVKAAYTRHPALLLHRMMQNHSREVREVATIRLEAAQRARNTCPHWILPKTGMLTNINTHIWNHLQLLLPSPQHAILTNHTSPEVGPLAVLCGDLHHHPKGTIDTKGLVGASITVVYSTLRRNAGPSPQRGTPHSLPTTSRVASIPPLPPVPHTDGTGSGADSAWKPRNEKSLPGLQKAAPLSRAGDTALNAHWLETRTRPPGDRPSPTANPTNGPKRSHFLSVFFCSIDPQKFIDGSTSSPGCSVINKNRGLFKFWADPVKPWITNKGPKAAIWSRGKRNNLAVNLFA